MATVTRVSAPGKLILIGEHGAVYGCPAVVAAVGMRLCASLSPQPDAGVRVHLPDVGCEEAWDWERVLRAAGHLRRRWQQYRASPGPESFARLHQGEPSQLVLTALAESAWCVFGAGVAASELPGLQLQVRSELPPGSGFGSSAAAALAVAGAFMATFAAPLDWTRLLEVVHEVERRQHGSPSGIDAATAFHGGVVSARRDGETLDLKPLQADPDVLRALRVFHTGSPADSTGAVVAGVRARRDRDRSGFDGILACMQEASEQFRTALVEGGDVAAMIEPMRRFQRQLEALGVVPDRVRRLVASIEQIGGAAKISGAGSLHGPGAGSLLAVHPEPERLDELQMPAGIERLPVTLGVEGVRVESVA